MFAIVGFVASVGTIDSWARKLSGNAFARKVRLRIAASFSSFLKYAAYFTAGIVIAMIGVLAAYFVGTVFARAYDKKKGISVNWSGIRYV